MKGKLFLVILGLGIVLLATTMTGGCGGAISESNTYYYPNWMPDGKIICLKIYAKSKEIGPGKMERIETKYYVTAMNDGGSNEQNLFEVSSEFKEITCSPTKELIAYVTVPDGKITISNYSGSSSTILPGISNAGYIDWSPDASKLVYTNSSRELNVVNADGSSNIQIATSAEAVAWRVGEKIVYDGDWVNAISPTGSDKRMLIDFSWLPQKKSSEEVVYLGKDGVCLINTDGTSNTMKFSGYERASLKLSFDNSKIVGGDFGGKDIWVINIDGTGLKQIR